MSLSANVNQGVGDGLAQRGGGLRGGLRPLDLVDLPLETLDRLLDVLFSHEHPFVTTTPTLTGGRLGDVLDQVAKQDIALRPRWMYCR